MLYSLFISLFAALVTSSGCKYSHTVASGESCQAFVTKMNVDLNAWNRFYPNMQCSSFTCISISNSYIFNIYLIVQQNTVICMDCLVNAQSNNCAIQPSQQCAERYVVRPNDSCYSIATNYGITVNQLQNLNQVIFYTF